MSHLLQLWLIVNLLNLLIHCHAFHFNLFQSKVQKIRIAKQTLLKKKYHALSLHDKKQSERLLQIYKSNLPELWINWVINSITQLFHLNKLTKRLFNNYYMPVPTLGTMKGYKRILWHSSCSWNLNSSWENKSCEHKQIQG